MMIEEYRNLGNRPNIHFKYTGVMLYMARNKGCGIRSETEDIHAYSGKGSDLRSRTEGRRRSPDEYELC